MPRVSLYFFSVAVLFGLLGMSLGLYMTLVSNHVSYPAHAHLNLIGWVGNAIFGSFYALAGESANRKLAWATLVLNSVAISLMASGLALYLNGVQSSLVPIIARSGEGLVFLSMLVFAISVWQCAAKGATAR